MIKRALVYLLVFTGLTTQAQRSSTFENWFSVALQKKINDFTFSLEEAWRVREFSFSRQNYTDLSLEYKFNKAFSATGGYRLALKKHMFNIEEVNNRVYFDLQGTYDAGDVEFSLRSRFQYTQQGREDDIVLKSQTYVRNRLKCKYNFSKEFSLAGSYEMMILMGAAEKLINENRYVLEVTYKFNKQNALSLGYILRNYVQVNDPLNVHIISLDYVFKL